MARHGSVSPFLEMPGGRSHRPRLLLILAMLALLVVAVFVALKILPLGPVTGLSSNRQARKFLNEARRMENQSLLLSARETYEQVSANPRLKPELRMEAAQRLAALERQFPNNPHAVEAALEKAYYFAPAGAQRDALRRELEAVRGRPVIRQTTPGTDGSEQTELVLPRPRNARVVARVGGEVVTLEEILYAWGQFNGNRTPSPEELEPFTKNYLDMVLLADEAHQRGLDQTPGVAIDLRVKRILALNQALTRQLIQGLKTPDAKSLNEYYTAQQGTPGKLPLVTIGHIVVRDIEGVRAVGKALREGRSFADAARQYSQDSKQLEDGYILGTITGKETSLKQIGEVPGLAARLMSYDTGTTTGPLELKSGYHWIKIVKKEAGNQAPPLEAVQDQVMLNFQKQQLARQRSELLKSLHENRTITVFNDKIKSALATASQPTTDTATTTGTTPAATPTPQATPAPAEAAAAPQATAEEPSPTPTAKPTPTPRAQSRRQTARSTGESQPSEDNAASTTNEE